MNKTLAAALAVSMALSASTAFAGGPVVIEDAEEVVAEKPATSVGILPILIGIVVICAIVCNQDDEDPQR